MADSGQIFKEQVGCHVTISSFDLFPAYGVVAIILAATFRSDVLIDFKLCVNRLSTLKKVVNEVVREAIPLSIISWKPHKDCRVQDSVHALGFILHTTDDGSLPPVINLVF